MAEPSLIGYMGVVRARLRIALVISAGVAAALIALAVWGTNKKESAEATVLMLDETELAAGSGADTAVAAKPHLADEVEVVRRLARARTSGTPFTSRVVMVANVEESYFTLTIAGPEGETAAVRTEVIDQYLAERTQRVSELISLSNESLTSTIARLRGRIDEIDQNLEQRGDAQSAFIDALNVERTTTLTKVVEAETAIDGNNRYLASTGSGVQVADLRDPVQSGGTLSLIKGVVLSLIVAAIFGVAATLGLARLDRRVRASTPDADLATPCIGRIGCGRGTVENDLKFLTASVANLAPAGLGVVVAGLRSSVASDYLVEGIKNAGFDLPLDAADAVLESAAILDSGSTRAVLLAVRTGVDHIEDVDTAVSLLRSAGIPVIGAVLVCKSAITRMPRSAAG